MGPDRWAETQILFELNLVATGRVISNCIKRISKRRSSFDGVIVHGLRYTSLSAPIWAKPLNVPVLCVVHGSDPVLVRIKSLLWMKRIVQNAQCSVSKVAVVGRLLLAHIAELGFDEDRTAVLPNGTELPSEAEVKSYPRNQSHPTYQILSVSRLIPLKGLDDAIKALAILNSRGMTNWL